MSFSYSRYKTFTTCKAKYKYQYIEKLGVPTSPAMDRGNEIHDNAEAYVKGDTSKLHEDTAKFFEDDLKHFKRWYKKDLVDVETEIVFDEFWNHIPNGWKSKEAWLRLKLDVVALDRAIPKWYSRKALRKAAFIVDYKTGKKYPDHSEQLELYALGWQLVNPDTDFITTLNYYIDQDDVMEFEYDLSLKNELCLKWADRSDLIETNKNWNATKNWSCRWCPFSMTKDGPCKKG